MGVLIVKNNKASGDGDLTFNVKFICRKWFDFI